MRHRVGRPSEEERATAPLLAVLLPGLVLLIVGFVGLVDADNHFDRMWPWWLIGLVGLGIVLLALGWPRQRPGASSKGSHPHDQ